MASPRLDIDQRYRAGLAVAGLFVALLIGRTLYLQTIKYGELHAKSESNRLRVQAVVPMRGLILDRDRRVIAGNRAAYSLSIIPSEVAKTQTLSRLAATLELDESEIEKRMKRNMISRSQLALIDRSLGAEKVAVLEEQNEFFPGAYYGKDQVREYHEGFGTECFTGYIGEVSPEEIKNLDPAVYRLGSVIGKAGIERIYDRELRGFEGTDFLEVTATGQLLGLIEELSKPPTPGNDIILTIDLDLQKAANAAFGEFCCGAAVVLDPRNGEVLALTSKPPNDANVFSSTMKPEQWRAIVSDSNKPLLNRPLDGLYPPGSTYKLVVAGAALELGLIDKSTLFTGCGGGYQFGSRYFRCWEKGGHGRLPVVNAIEQSCDVYFYQLNLRLGLEKFADYSRQCGFGKRTGIDLPQEAAGLVPNEEWYNKRLGKRNWTLAVLLNLGIGQGELLSTPLQLAQFYAGLANGGKVFKPHLLRSIIGPDGRETFRGGEHAFSLPFSEPTMQILREGLFNVIQGPRGTARGARITGSSLAGKTGTAQNPHGNDHSWFVGYAPADNPEIVACVIVENAGHGSTYAAPAVRNIIKTYLTKHRLPGADTTMTIVEMAP